MIPNGILYTHKSEPSPIIVKDASYHQQLMVVDAETHSEILGEREPKSKLSNGSLPLELREPHGRWRGRIVGARGDENTRRSWSTESTK